MHANVKVLHDSSLARVLDFRCLCGADSKPVKEYQPCAAISFTRRGAFEYGLGSRRYSIHSGVVLLETAHTTRRVAHYGALNDECTAVELLTGFPAAHVRFRSPVISATPRLQIIHWLILKGGRTAFPAVKLQLDALIVELVREIGRIFEHSELSQPVSETESPEFYLASIDRAKSLMQTRFRDEVSLAEIARSAGISVFHFSRVFRRLVGYAPHQYLILLRLAHAELLLLNTRLSGTEICFESGFCSMEYFIAAFRQRYGQSPGKYRRSRVVGRLRSYPRALRS
jgi:AraC family transcriptional regulator